MHVSLAFDPTSAFAEMTICSPALSSARRGASRSFDGAATGAPVGAACFGERPGRGASLLSRRENTPI
jgi:hypothetical protein